MGILIMVYPGFIPRLSLSAVAVVVFVISSAKRRANLLEKLSLTPFLKSDLGHRRTRLFSDLNRLWCYLDGYLPPEFVRTVIIPYT